MHDHAPRKKPVEARRTAAARTKVLLIVPAEMLVVSSNCVRLQRVATSQSKRSLHDLLTLPHNKPIISYGPPGRSAVTGHVATVFGCTGFLGRYLVAKLAKSGTQIIIPYRDEDEKRHLRPMGDLGQIIPTEWDLRREDQIEECLRHSDIVYNLVGRNYETKNFTFDAVHKDGAHRIASIAARAGVARFVHVSHLNASHDSPSEFYKSKARGEDLVKEAFPTATIVRPAAMYGYEDKFLTNMAVWPIWWKLNHMRTKVRPVHVFDVAQALTNLLSVPSLPGTLNLPGPSTLTHEYLLTLVSAVTCRAPDRAPILPKRIALALSKVAQNVWWPAISPDEVLRRYLDDVDVPGDWDKVGVVPDEIEQHAITYLRRYRSAENYSRAVQLPASREALYELP
ncbi:NADH dehydrogenase [Laetiporus sulphureus 93-53]|uniref:NADH dehydrogenase n=1 Tax=Laetiporus sulphureus 93-53 TaxID=1314785 RepID=A0A165FSF2_9APHY|nr:NADH dehydrogenase [Laetiporus sulphureus 93-53]KZT09353.1 NADH dehydrogenase [Laetiporus sulphureus 93-53]